MGFRKAVNEAERMLQNYNYMKTELAIEQTRDVGNTGKINELKETLRLLDIAIESLEEGTQTVIKDIYIGREKWETIRLKRYFSNNTINRYRKKGIKQIQNLLYDKDVKNVI